MKTVRVMVKLQNSNVLLEVMELFLMMVAKMTHLRENSNG